MGLVTRVAAPLLDIPAAGFLFLFSAKFETCKTGSVGDSKTLVLGLMERQRQGESFLIF